MRRAPTNPRPLVPNFPRAGGSNAIIGATLTTPPPTAPAGTAGSPQATTIAQGSNATNAGGFGSVPSALSEAVQTSKIWNVSIPAQSDGVPGTLTISASGTQFYVILASAPVNIRVANGIYNSFSTNNKLMLKKPFNGMEIQNENAFPVALSLFVGWDDFTSYSFTLTNQEEDLATYETSPEPQTSARIVIPDLSGQTFEAADGSTQIAVSRSMIIISNVDASQGLFLQGGLTSSTNNSGVLWIPAGQSLQHLSGGNFCLTINASTSVNAAVSEIYNSIPA
jgi:hypothetical protein